MNRMVPITLGDFSPDADPFTSGILLDVDNLYGTVKGLRALPGLEDVSGALLSDPVLGTYVFETQSGDSLVLSGTTRHIYRLVAGAWELFDGATSEAIARYGTGSRWRMAGWGNFIFAANGVDQLQVSQGYAAFRDLSDVQLVGSSDPPLPSIVATTDYGIFLVRVNSDEWWFTRNPLDWTPDIAALSTSGTIKSTPGIITAAVPLRDGCAFYKNSSMYFMAFTGPPFIWEPKLISKQVGCANQEAVVNVGDVHIFLGIDDFYMFDGATLRPLENNLKEWFFARLNMKYRSGVLGRYDQTNNLVFFHYPSTDSTDGVPDEWLCYNTRAKKWTRGTQSVSDVVTPDIPLVETDMTYEQFGQAYNTYDDVPDVTYNSELFYSATNNVPAIVDASGQLKTYSGDAGDSAILTGNIGDGWTYQQLSMVRPTFAIWPTRATLFPFRIQAPGQPIPDPGPFPYVVDGPQAVLQRDGNFNLISTGRIHRLQLSFEGDVEITGMMLDLFGVGTV